MQEVIEAFGINHTLIVAQIFNFVILGAALWYFLYTPILSIIKEREQKIVEGVRNAEEARNAKESTEAERVLILKAAHEEAALIVSRAQAHAEEKHRLLIDEAQEKIASKRNEMEREIEYLKEKSIKESEGEITKLAILTAEQILNKELSK